MYSILYSYTLHGLTAVKVTVEVSVTPGLPKFEIIGLPDTSIRESKERIFQSLRANGFTVPSGNITVNLAPAELKKKGSLFDLPAALGLLIASGQVKAAVDPSLLLIAGELTLNAQINPVSGIFSAGKLCSENRIPSILFPYENSAELSFFSGLTQYPVSTLADAVSVISGRGLPDKINKTSPESESSDFPSHSPLDYSQVYGNDNAIKAIQTAIVGKMNFLLIGPPGCGKTMLIKRIPGLLPELSASDAADVTMIHSAAGLLKNRVIKNAPFREIHSSITRAAFFGGGMYAQPGEISLAHKGILFMDELSEFPRTYLQELRIPLEEKTLSLRRLNYFHTYPCDFMLAAASNPCPCGYYGDDQKSCTCSEIVRNRFYTKFSAPLLDRIDLIIYINRPNPNKIFKTSVKSTASLRQEINGPLQYVRDNPCCLSDEHITEITETKNNIQTILKDAYKAGYVSLRRIKKIMRTAIILSLFDGFSLREEHVFQAMQFCRVKW